MRRDVRGKKKGRYGWEILYRHVMDSLSFFFETFFFFLLLSHFSIYFIFSKVHLQMRERWKGRLAQAFSSEAG